MKSDSVTGKIFFGASVLGLSASLLWLWRATAFAGGYIANAGSSLNDWSVVAVLAGIILLLLGRRAKALAPVLGPTPRRDGRFGRSSGVGPRDARTNRYALRAPPQLARLSPQR